MKLSVVALTALALGGVPLFAQTPAPTPDPDKDPPRFADTVDVESELPAVPPSAATPLKVPVPVPELPLRW